MGIVYATCITRSLSAFNCRPHKQFYTLIIIIVTIIIKLIMISREYTAKSSVGNSNCISLCYRNRIMFESTRYTELTEESSFSLSLSFLYYIGYFVFLSVVNRNKFWLNNFISRAGTQLTQPASNLRICLCECV